MNEQLESCPFCGTRAQLYREMTLHKVICLNATCTAHDTIGFETPEQAIDAWNKRLDTTNLMQLVEANAELASAITDLHIENARLRAELVAKTPPPAVAPYHRLDDIRQLPSPTINACLESESIDEAWKHSQGGNAAETKAVLVAEFPEYGEQLSICYFCDNQSNDLYALQNGMAVRLCTACALHHGAILAD